MNSLFDKFKSLLTEIVSPPFHEMIRSAPDSLFLGSILLSLFTQSFSLIVLSMAMAEFGIIHRLLANILDSVNNNWKTQSSEICKMGIPSPYQISAIGQLLKEYAFPNATLFFLAAVIVYICSGILSFKDELEQIDRQNKTTTLWTSRTYISLAFSAILMILFILYNVYYGCITVIPAFGSVAFGSFVGMCIFLLHFYLFGKQAVNFLGIPELKDRKIIYGQTS